MSETLKIYGGMLALGSFTAQELSRFTNVKLSSVHTVLRRLEGSLETVAVEPTNRRGGQNLRRRLRADAVPALRQKLDTFAQSLQPFSATQPAAAARSLRSAGAAPPIAHEPLALRVANDILVRLLPQAQSEKERIQLLAAAELQLRSVRPQQIGDPNESAHVGAEVAAALGRVAALQKESTPMPTAPVAIQVWRGAPGISTTIDKLKKKIEKTMDLLVTPVPDEPCDVPASDGVILVVDSSQEGARLIVGRASRLCRDADKPLLVFDKRYDSKLRALVLHEGNDYVPDAQTLDSTGAMNIISKAVNKAVKAVDPSPSIGVRDILPERRSQERTLPLALLAATKT